MPRVHSYTVVADLPESLRPLKELANNLWWTWNHPARSLFRRIAKERSPSTKFNPVELVNSLSAEQVQALPHDQGFMAQLREVYASFQHYKATRNWWRDHSAHTESQATTNSKIAYFSLEFGLHETLPIYSGGLGVLAGDHLKAASDLGLPLAAVGLLYYEGYFSQYLNADGWQQESYNQVDRNQLPIRPVLTPDGRELVTSVDIKGETIYIKAWKVSVGLVDLYLLDTNCDENLESVRPITARLYGGDMHWRIRQELVLGVGGYRVLAALNLIPDVVHLNEGHSAFIALEQMKKLINYHGLTFEEALVAVSSSNHFTTHTPVPAGNDVFPRHILEAYLEPYAKELGVTTEKLLRLGRVHEENHDEPFSMTILALKTSYSANGVSELHGRVSRRLWQSLWPELPQEETPITAITNGIHTTTWLSRDLAELFSRYLGPAWKDHIEAEKTWRAVSQIPDEELWRIRSVNRAILVAECRERLTSQLMKRGAGPNEIDNATQALNPEALTIGFARRFASYKRAYLILHDIERLLAIISRMDRPVQFIFAGKAHPADNTGKELIAKLVHAQHRPELKGRFVFIEDYDMHLARRMVQGVDVWLNNPRRPLEACGTSGIKVGINGGLNFSVLDGWWCEAFNGRNGWSIGQGEEYNSTEYQDNVESRSIYDLLEREIVPLFYNRNNTGLPVDWLAMAKNSIQTVTPQFSAHRMVQDYATKNYLPTADLHQRLVGNGFSKTRSTALELKTFIADWRKTAIKEVTINSTAQQTIGEHVPIKVRAKLGPFSPDNISVEVRHGSIDATNHFLNSKVSRLNHGQPTGETGEWEFHGELPADHAGTFGFTVRLVPVVDGSPNPTVPGLVTWWE